MDTDLDKAIATANGKRRVRIIKPVHVKEMKALINLYRDDITVTAIVVKAQGYFVNDGNKKRCLPSTILIASRYNDWHIVVYLADARRPYRDNQRISILRDHNRIIANRDLLEDYRQ